MKKTNIFFILFSFLVLGIFASCGDKIPAPDEYGFYNDMDKAVIAAEKTKKNILLFITMSGFDEESEIFTNQVLHDNSYKSLFDKEFVSVHFDFGSETYIKSEGDADFNAQITKNISFARVLNLQYTPAVYLMNCNGYAFADEIYAESFASAESLYSLVSEYKEDFELFDQMVNETKKGKPAERVEAINKIYQLVEDQYVPTLTGLFKQVPQIDKNNESGLVSYLYFVYVMEESQRFVQGGDYFSAVQVLGESANSGYLEGEEKQQAYYMAGQLLISSRSYDISSVIAYLDLAVKAAPDTELAESCRNILAQINELMPETSGSSEEN